MNDLNQTPARSQAEQEALLAEINEQQQIQRAQRETANNEPYQANELPIPPALAEDELTAPIKARQNRLEQLSDPARITEQARQRVMQGARAEFAALMQELNASQAYTLAQGQGRRTLKKMATEPLLKGAHTEGDPPNATALAESFCQDENL
jgi:hypothetical protein